MARITEVKIQPDINQTPGNATQMGRGLQGRIALNSKSENAQAQY